MRGAALRPAGALGARAGRGVSGRRGLRRRDADDDRRAARRPRRPRGRARPRPPRHRAGPRRLRRTAGDSCATCSSRRSRPQAVSFRGLRLPLVGAVVGARRAVRRPGRRSRARGRPLERAGARLPRAPARAGATTGTLKLVGIPLWALWRTRSVSGAVLVGLSANVVNQLDTRPGRALKAFLRRLRAPRRPAAAGPRAGRPPRSLRSPRDDDARRCRVERARRHARFGVREAVDAACGERARSARSPPSPSSANAGRSAR